jgi:hypothetical protein
MRFAVYVACMGERNAVVVKPERILGVFERTTLN